MASVLLIILKCVAENKCQAVLSSGNVSTADCSPSQLQMGVEFFGYFSSEEHASVVVIVHVSDSLMYQKYPAKKLDLRKYIYSGY